MFGVKTSFSVDTRVAFSMHTRIVFTPTGRAFVRTMADDPLGQGLRTARTTTVVSATFTRVRAARARGLIPVHSFTIKYESNFF